MKLKATCFAIAATAIFASNTASQTSDFGYERLLHKAKEMTAKRDAALKEADSNLEKLSAYQKEKRETLTKLLGIDIEEAQKREPLVYIESRVKSGKFTIYKLIVDGRMSVNFYKPNSNGGDNTFPAVLLLPGHEQRGKGANTYQMTALMLAGNGIAVLVPDPISEGERMQMMNPDGTTKNMKATSEHSQLQAGSVLTGNNIVKEELKENLALFNVLYYNKISGVKIDKKNIGVMGNSGGGAQASYLGAVDNRIKAICCCSWFTRRINMMEKYGPDDPCQWIPGEIKSELEISDLYIINAPRPTLIMSGSLDFIDFEGAKEGANELRKIYTTLKAKKNFNFFSEKSEHGITETKREKATMFFRQELGVKTKVITEEMLEAIPMDARKLQCSPTGQMLTSFHTSEALPNKYIRLTRENQGEKTAFNRQSEKMNRLMMRGFLGIGLQGRKDTSAAKGVITGTSDYIIIADSGKFSTKALMLLDSIKEIGGKAEIVELAFNGNRGDSRKKRDKKFWNDNYRSAALALMLGGSLVAEQTEDLLAMLEDQKVNFNVITIGNINVAARHALYLYKGQPAKAKLLSYTEIDGIKDWESIARRINERGMLECAVPNAIKLYNLDDIDPTKERKMKFVKAEPQKPTAAQKTAPKTEKFLNDNIVTEDDIQMRKAAIQSSKKAAEDAQAAKQDDGVKTRTTKTYILY
jgi:cephalosporin-C deacetylase-like acetyl esterase